MSTEDGQTIEEIYRQMEPIEHILERPDSYVGSIKASPKETWVFDFDQDRIVEKEVTISDALLKITDEVLVNAVDQYARLTDAKSDNPVTSIKIVIDQEANLISVYNNGEGIPIVMHKDANMYLPEMLFGNLLTGSNYDDNEEKTTGGRNGYGAKLANIFSTEFTVETVDSNEKKKYVQTFRNNMYEHDKPKITKCSNASYTKITFHPDLPRFGMNSLDDDIISVLTRRAYDIAGVVGKDLTVHLNGKKLLGGTGKSTPFERYTEMYVGKNRDTPKVYYQPHPRWELCVCMSENEEMKKVSFVNGINTRKGGKHVDYVVDKITKGIIATLKKKKGGDKKYTGLKSVFLKNNMWIFLKSTIVNPTFDSQCKEELTTIVSNFGSSFSLNIKKPEHLKFFEQIIKKTDIVNRSMMLAKHREELDNVKQAKTKKSVINLKGYPKLEDANKAGTKKSNECVLILTEGDSAKAMAMKIYSDKSNNINRRDYYGIFPLRGKFINPRDKSEKAVLSNAEVQALFDIIGLTYKKKYTSTEGLRYGSVLIMTDQDVDGYHIQGLVINFFQYYWPELLEIPGFLRTLPTPIIKSKKGKGKKMETLSFYTEHDFHIWEESLTEKELKKWSRKYYKGLGTSSPVEAKEIMANIDDAYQQYISNDPKETSNAVLLGFDNKADARKDWLSDYDASENVNNNDRIVTYPDFINKRLKHFSTYDNSRSIACMVDGLKVSQRKVLYGIMKKNLSGEIKVAQIAGYISEHCAYHHGEASLHGTIINMAQNYLGSNNINLLFPSGQFGTREMGGKDHASPRYIFTYLSKIATAIYHPDDTPLLDNLVEEGHVIEPKMFVPVIPMILVNGTDGIGTGWSTTVPCHDPKDIIHNMRQLIAGKSCDNITPWYRGYTGVIKAEDDTGKYSSNSTWRQVNDTTLEITELPIMTWTYNYNVFLESLIYDTSVKDTKKLNAQMLTKVNKQGDSESVKFILKFKKPVLAKLMKDPEKLMKKLKLTSTSKLSTNNMHLFDENDCIRKYGSALEIMESFFPIRLHYYVLRKEYMEKKLQREFDMNAAKVRFIEDYQTKEIELFNRSIKDIESQLFDREYPKFMKSNDDTSSKPNYDYLIDMPIRSMTKEKLEKLRKARDLKETELLTLQGKTVDQIWLEDLDALESAYDSFLKDSF